MTDAGAPQTGPAGAVDDGLLASAEHNHRLAPLPIERKGGSEDAAGDARVVEEYRKHLYEALHAASRDYDQSILTLAAGTLALSVTFAHDITPTPVAGTQTILLYAWTSLVLSLVFIVISFLTSQRTIRLLIQSIDPPPAQPHTRIARIGARLGRLAAPVTGLLNLLAGVTLIGGLALLGWYALANT